MEVIKTATRFVFAWLATVFSFLVVVTLLCTIIGITLLIVGGLWMGLQSLIGSLF